MPGAGFTYRRKGRGVGLARWQDPDVGRNIGEQREPTQENKPLPNPAHVICILVGQKMQIIPSKRDSSTRKNHGMFNTSNELFKKWAKKLQNVNM